VKSCVCSWRLVPTCSPRLGLSSEDVLSLFGCFAISTRVLHPHTVSIHMLSVRSANGHVLRVFSLSLSSILILIHTHSHSHSHVHTTVCHLHNNTPSDRCSLIRRQRWMHRHAHFVKQRQDHHLDTETRMCSSSSTSFPSTDPCSSS
jgi:hypothetical protein